MRFVYSRAGGNSASGARLACRLDAGWLAGANARGVPHRQAWIRHGAAVSDIWHQLASLAPAPRRWWAPRHSEQQQAYLLQQDPDGFWCVDPWGHAVGAIVPAGSAAHKAAPTGFIIELRHAG